MPGAARLRRPAPTACCRLLKALRHEAPNVETTAKRLGVKAAASGRLRAQDLEHRARRQDVGRARARGPDRRRHDACRRPSARPAASPAPSSSWASTPRSAARRRSARRSRSASSTTPRPAIRSSPASRRSGARRGQAVSAGAGDLASPPRSARTTSSSARRCTSCWRRIPRSISCTTPRPTRW